MTGARPLYLHIGLQKTGTSYLQSIFWQNTAELAEQGLDMVPGSKRATFQLMLCVRERFDPKSDPPAVVDALRRLPELLAAAPGDRALISEEALGSANDEQVRRLVEACADREVHVVVTLRDLGRQIPSSWQQLVQSGGSMSWSDFLDTMQAREGQPQTRVWNGKDVAAILERWSRFVPQERIHLVTVPASGGDPEVLLHRFCSVLGIDWARLNREVARSNRGIGLVQAELLRRVNERLPAEARQREAYGDIGKRWLAVQVLGPQDGDRVRIPARYAGWVAAVSARFSDAIRAGRYDVVGDLADLDPAPSAFVEGACEVTEAEVLEAATQALADVVVGRVDERRERIAAAARAAEEARLKDAQRVSPSGRVRRILTRR